MPGEGFFHGCDDVGGGSSSGLGRSSADPAPDVTPMRNVDLVVTQGSHRWTLGTADAAAKPFGHVTRLVWLPEGLHPGRAMLTAGMAQATFTVGH